MLYEEYETYKLKYYEIQKKYNEILNEKEELFSLTQPKAISYDGEVVDGGNPKNVFDEYLMLKEKKNIDQRLDEIKSILMDRKELLTSKEEELKDSKHIQDRIYVYRYLHNLTIKKIAMAVPCGEATVYRTLRIIRNNLK